MSPKELIYTINFSLKNNFSILITGEPGVGKSSLVEAAAIETGYDLILAHPVVSDPTDFKGLPYAEDGIASFLPFGDLRKLIGATRPTIYFLDDLGQATPEVQKALMQLILARKIGEHSVSKWVRFVGASNRRQDGAGVSGILAPVLSRFHTIINLNTSVDDWIDWGVTNGMPHSLLGFIKSRPELLVPVNEEKALLDRKKAMKEMANTVSPRTLSHVGKWINANISDDVLLEVLGGAAGTPFATEYTSFLRLFDTLPRIEEILSAPSTTPVPALPDQKYALTSYLAKHTSGDTILPILTYLERVGLEFTMVTMRIIGKEKQKDILKVSPDFAKWAIANAKMVLPSN